MSDIQAAIAERVAPKRERSTVERLLEVQRPELERGLAGLGISVDRFARLVLTEVKRTPKLRQCTAESLLGAVMLAAQLGLEPGPMGLSYLVPRWSGRAQANEVHFEIGYRGYIDLALRSGRVLDIAAHVVYEADEFHFAYGSTPELHHVPALNVARGPIVCAYAVARLVGGGAPFEVLDIITIEERRARGGAADNGPWVTDWPAMARKTAVRALEPYLPRSAELVQAFRADGATITDYTTANLADSDALDVPVVDDDEPSEGGPEGSDDSSTTQGEPAPPPSEEAPEETTSSDAPLPSGPAAIAGEVELPPALVVSAHEAVAAYRATKKAGAAAAHRALDEYLVTILEVGIDLEGLDSEKATALSAWLVEHPIGADR